MQLSSNRTTINLSAATMNKKMMMNTKEEFLKWMTPFSLGFIFERAFSNSGLNIYR